MSTPRDYYEVLHLGRDAGADEIKRRYRELALKLHPDRNPDPHAAEQFKEVSEAYAVLSDPEKRAAYDKFGHAGVDQRWATQEDIFRGVDLEDMLRGFGLGGFEDLFAGMFGGGGQRRGRDVRAALRVTLQEVATGTRKQLNVPHHKPCGKCQGSGAQAGTGRVTCPTCRGSGMQRIVRGGGAFQFVQTGPCSSCRGRGQITGQPCKVCEGSGAVPDEKPLEIDIPAGVQHGSVMRVQGAGQAGPAGSPPGDLLVVLQVEPNSQFERRGSDLFTMALVPFPIAALGGTIELEMLDGTKEKVHVVEGTQGGSVLTLDHRGLPGPRGQRGHLHVLLQIQVPTKMTGRERELLRQLQQEWQGSAAKPNLREALHGWLGKLGKQDEDDEEA